MFLASVVATTGHAASTPQGGPPSTSSASVVAAARPTASTPQGGCHRHLQFWWWPLPDIPPTPPRGPSINVFSFSGGRCRTCRQQPPGGASIDIFSFDGGRCRTCHQHPSGGPPSTSSTSLVAAAGPVASTPQVGRHRRLQHRWWPLSDLPPAPLGDLPSMFLIIDSGRSTAFSSGSPAPAPPEGPPSMFLSVDGGRSRLTSSDTSRRPTIDIS
jgi:hypothetical protein